MVDQQGYRVNNSTIQIIIKNQPFIDSYKGTNYYLHYNIRYKGHFSKQWTTSYTVANYTMQNINPKNWVTPPPQLIADKNSDYTITAYNTADYPANSTLDFQVMAYTMHDGQIRVFYDQYDFKGFMIQGYVLDDQSDWSPTQTINLADGSVSATSTTPTSSSTTSPSTSTVPELSLIAILPLLLSVFSVAVIVRHRKNR